MRAKAFTAGNDIVLPPGSRGSGASPDRRLLAHELVHVLQQRALPDVVRRQPDDDEERKAAVDRTRAMMIDLLYADPSSSWTSILIANAEKLSERFEDPPGPRTKRAAAVALLRIRDELVQRSKTSPRADDGALITLDFGEAPWTPERPRTVDEMALFDMNQVMTWSFFATHAPEAESTAGSTPSRVRRTTTRAATTVPEPKRSGRGGQGANLTAGIDSDDPNDITVDFYTLVKTPGMAWNTKDGRAHIIAAIIQQIWNESGGPGDAWLSFDIETSMMSPGPKQLQRGALDIAHKIADIRWKSPIRGMSEEKYADYFNNKLRVASQFTVPVWPNFYHQLNRHMPVPRHLREGLPKPPSRFGRERDTATSEIYKLMLANNSIAERELFAMRQILYAQKAGHRSLWTRARPGVPVENDWIFVYNQSAEESVWLAPDTNLWVIDERALMIENVRQGVLRAQGAVMLANGVLLACLAVMVAPAAASITSATVRLGAEAIGGLIEGGAEAIAVLRGVRSVSQLRTALTIYVGSNPVRAMALAELAFSTGATVLDRGLSQSLKDLTTFEGAVSLLFDILLAREAGLTRNRPRLPRGSTALPKGEIDLPRGKPRGIDERLVPSDMPRTERQQATSAQRRLDGDYYVRPNSPEYYRLLHEGWTAEMVRSGLQPNLPQILAQRGAPLRRGVHRTDIETPAEAYRIYLGALARAGGREVGIYRNVETGRYAVTVGSPFEVGAPWQGTWEGVLHFHQNPANVLTYRMPAPADVEGAALAAFRAEGRPVTEFVEFPIPGAGRGRVAYTALYRDGKMRITIETIRPGGRPLRQEFSSLEEYQAEYGRRKRYVDPESEEFEWIMRDLRRNEDDFEVNGPRTMAGSRRSNGPQAPPIPPGAKSLQDFGMQIMKWGHGQKGAQDRIDYIRRNPAKVRQELLDHGVTPEMATGWRDFYAYHAKSGNKAAEWRVHLMELVADLLSQSKIESGGARKGFLRRIWDLMT